MSMSAQRRRGRVCGIDNCRSRTFHVAADGHTYCSNGHQAEDQLTQVDDEAYSGRGTARVTRRQSDEIETTSKYVEGAKGIELGLQAFQLILRKQTHWLIHALQYPQQLEVVVRDLWYLRVQMLTDMIGNAAEERSSHQLFSTQTETDGSESNDEGKSSKRVIVDKTFPKIVESLSLLYLSLVLLKIPICCSDVREWVNADGFTYVRAAAAIPQSMEQKMAPKWRAVFNAQAGLNDPYQQEKLQATIMDLVSAFQRIFRMKISSINHHLLLARFVIGLSLPLEVFSAVVRLLKLLDIDLDFPSSRQQYRKISTFPEVRLMSLVIIALKLIYPFDGVSRKAQSAFEPAALKINWESWQSVREASEKQKKQDSKIDNKALFDTTEAQVFSMTKDQIDTYLGWFGRTWLEGDGNEHGTDIELRRALNQMFPVHDNSTDLTDHEYTNADGEPIGDRDGDEESDIDRTLKAIQMTMTPQEIFQDGELVRSESPLLRPGDRYKHYYLESQLPALAKPLFAAAADLVGLSLQSMLVAVYQIEVKILNWKQKAG